MSEFVMHLQCPSQYERIDAVTNFVGVDPTGSFGILPGHERMITALSPGIMSFQIRGQAPEYIGLPESVLYFVDNELFISTRRYLKDRDYAHLSTAWEKMLAEQEEGTVAMRETMRAMEEALLKQLLLTSGAHRQ